MNKDNYKKKIEDTLSYYLSEHNLQNIINNLISHNIASYNQKDKTKITIKSSDSKEMRIKQCITKNENTLYEIESMFIEQAYRYSIYFQCDEFILNNKIKDYIKIEDFKTGNIKMINDFGKPRYLENSKLLIFSFCKTINPYISKLDATKNIIYNTLWIYHKNLKILEHRFNLIGFKEDDLFYETTFIPQLDRLIDDFGIHTREYRTTPMIEYIVENKKNEVSQISQYMGLKKNSSAKLKVGNDLIMPFIGDLEIIMNENKDLFEQNIYTKKIEEIIVKYILDTKKNANYKSRLLSWHIENKCMVNVNILFSYREKSYDLFNFLEPKRNNMEMMNYAIEYICKVGEELSKSK